MQPSRYDSPCAPIPKGACDCHMHVFGSIDDYPPSPRRTYTPRPASLVQYRKMTKALGLERAVFVQASAYGADNRCLLDAMSEFGDGARGIAGIDNSTPESALQDMNRLGVRGIRINAAARNQGDLAAIRAEVDQAIDRILPLGWHVQLFVSLPVIQNLAAYFSKLKVPVVFDHMGHATGDFALSSPEFRTLLNLIGDGKCWVKLAGADRISQSDIFGFSDALPKMRALISANPEMLVWGSDWPHTAKHGHTEGEEAPMIDYRPLQTADLLNVLIDACDDPLLLERILVDNATTLYGFN